MKKRKSALPFSKNLAQKTRSYDPVLQRVHEVFLCETLVPLVSFAEGILCFRICRPFTPRTTLTSVDLKSDLAFQMPEEIERG
jgi:hypothetical protein